MEFKRSTRLIWWGLVILFSLIACQSLGGGGAPAPTTVGLDLLPTPDLTLTAVFSPLGTLPPEVTEETEEPAETEEVMETATLAPEAEEQTSTSVPSLPTAKPPAGSSSGVDTTLSEPSSVVNPGESVVASLLLSPPVIDGNPGDWTSVWYSAENVVFGQEFHAGKADLSADFKIGWDFENLYVAVIVRDSKFVQNATGAQLYQGDSLEILFDTDLAGDQADAFLNGDDYQLGFSPGNAQEGDAPESYVWTPKEKTGPLTRVTSAAVLTEDGYVMEISIPWFLLEVSPDYGRQFGFLLSVSDNDSVNRNEQHSVVSFASYRFLFDPTTWGVLELSLGN